MALSVEHSCILFSRTSEIVLTRHLHLFFKQPPAHVRPLYHLSSSIDVTSKEVRGHECGAAHSCVVAAHTCAQACGETTAHKRAEELPSKRHE